MRSRDLPGRHVTNFFFDFCWCYFNILLLVVLHLFCYFLNTICTFIVFYIFLPYSRPEFLIFFVIRFIFSSCDFLNIPVSHLSIRLTALRSAFTFDPVLLFHNGSSFFLFFTSFIPNNWVITNAAHLTSLLSSVMLLVCIESIISLTSLVFSFNLTQSILLRFWGFGKLFFFISSTIFSSMFYFSTVSILS